MVILWTKKEDDLLQFSSSELSPQSFWLSHLQWSGMQLLFSQRNSWGPQVFSSFSSATNKHTDENDFKSAWILMHHYSTSTCNHHFLRVSQTHVWHRVQNIPKHSICHEVPDCVTTHCSPRPPHRAQYLQRAVTPSLIWAQLLPTNMEREASSVHLPMIELHILNQSQGQCLRRKKSLSAQQAEWCGCVFKSTKDASFFFLLPFSSLLNNHKCVTWWKCWLIRLQCLIQLDWKETPKKRCDSRK